MDMVWGRESCARTEITFFCSVLFWSVRSSLTITPKGCYMWGPNTPHTITCLSSQVFTHHNHVLTSQPRST
ncbi:hypothetical protein JHK82_014767 [Glycine max]|uniref:Uncharacterized protein n=2 Tax=Glycine subgen. Soja TaxID=1462606 RepID=A0A0R0JE89_SOYBN|nr:hypothetical protein JHK87_014686 [Glycine soja]KAG5031154.1 hypothetical protein JHK85_015136 [Glycine max]KAG5045379.1 hypothetical protein JHK86_014785 [Glycine max]KAG5147886.1 hypothetical protein JHK82_014767 [Glycine max]KAH1124913.1 hypothetical protein GYH30_014519 [Glycine max]